MPQRPTPADAKRPKTKGGLYRHRLRPEWGVAVLAWEAGGSRGYQFDDGQLREFKQGYYNLLTPVDETGGAVAALEDELLRTASEPAAGAPPVLPAPAYGLEEQLTIFRALYPEGFAGAAWQKDHRGIEGDTRLKRHRAAALADARTLLAPERLTSLCDEERHADVIKALLAVLGRTNLVSGAALDCIEAADPGDLVVLAKSLRNLVAGERRFGTRLTRFTAAFHAACGKRPTWRMATVIPALIAPETHVCVRKSVFMMQAAIVEPNGDYTRGPRRRGYKAFQTMALRLRDLLADAGAPPADLFDVHDFVWLTLRPAAAKHLTG